MANATEQYRQLIESMIERDAWLDGVQVEEGLFAGCAA
jgi:hypothetical protein